MELEGDVAAVNPYLPLFFLAPWSEYERKRPRASTGILPVVRYAPLPDCYSYLTHLAKKKPDTQLYQHHIAL